MSHCWPDSLTQICGTRGRWVYTGPRSGPKNTARYKWVQNIWIASCSYLLYVTKNPLTNSFSACWHQEIMSSGWQNNTSTNFSLLCHLPYKICPQLSPVPCTPILTSCLSGDCPANQGSDNKPIPGHCRSLGFPNLKIISLVFLVLLSSAFNSLRSSVHICISKLTIIG